MNLTLSASSVSKQIQSLDMFLPTSSDVWTSVFSAVVKKVSAPGLKIASGRNTEQVYVLSVLMMLNGLQLTNRPYTLKKVFCNVDNTSRKKNEGRHELVVVQSINAQWSAPVNIF